MTKGSVESSKTSLQTDLLYTEHTHPGSRKDDTRSCRLFQPAFDAGHPDYDINSLPVEVLSHMLIIGHQSLPLCDLTVFRFLSAVILTCRWWYNVAVSTPSLWTSIRMQLGLYYRCSTPVESDDFIPAPFLERSGNKLLDICSMDHSLWKIDRQEEKATLPIFVKALEAIRPHLQRCQNIQGWFWREVAARQLFPLPGEVPHLTALELELVFAGEIHLFNRGN